MTDALVPLARYETNFVIVAPNSDIVKGIFKNITPIPNRSAILAMRNNSNKGAGCTFISSTLTKSVRLI